MHSSFRLLLGSSVLLAGWQVGGQTPAVKTAEPRLLEDWVMRTAGPNGTEAQARTIAEGQRPTVRRLRDPFTSLAKISCDQRRAGDERVVWENASLMVLVDKFDTGPKLLLTPKEPRNFIIDLSTDERSQASRVAAATCDALMLAAGGQPAAAKSNCSIVINPPAGVSLSQMHVHIVSPTSARVDDKFFRMAQQQLTRLLGGKGCL